MIHLQIDIIIIMLLFILDCNVLLLLLFFHYCFYSSVFALLSHHNLFTIYVNCMCDNKDLTSWRRDGDVSLLVPCSIWPSQCLLPPWHVLPVKLEPPAALLCPISNLPGGLLQFCTSDAAGFEKALGRSHLL